MIRDPDALAQGEFDVLVVGGGIHGACIARDAALRGLRVALVEQGDFCCATSHNSLKTIHGGIRYLQHLNLKRAVESIREQQIFLRTAPHLVQPLKFLMPTYGYGMRGPFAMAAGISLYEFFSALCSLFDYRRLGWPKGRLLSRQACLELAPGISTDNLKGGAIWADAQVALADKAVLQILQHAVDHDAVVCNHTKATALLSDEGGAYVVGALVHDRFTGKDLRIKARMVVNATGPWMGNWMNHPKIPDTSLRVGLVKSMNLVVDRPAPAVAIGIKSSRASDSKVDVANRLYFSVPWLDKTMIGTTHFTYHENKAQPGIEQVEIDQFVSEFNEAYPQLEITPADVLYCYQGLTPGDDSAQSDGAKLHEGKLVAHEHSDNVAGVLSVIGIKWTTARLVAEQAVDMLLTLWNDPRTCQTRRAPIPDYNTMPHECSHLDDDALQAFVMKHVSETQANCLDDIVLRRTNDLVLGRLLPKQIKVIADALSRHFQWSEKRLQAEVNQLLSSGLSPHYRQRIANEFSGVQA